jgi:hypothetical protein
MARDPTALVKNLHRGVGDARFDLLADEPGSSSDSGSVKITADGWVCVRAARVGMQDSTKPVAT